MTIQRYACLDRFGHLDNTVPRARLCVVCAAANSTDAPECVMLTDRTMFVGNSRTRKEGSEDYGQRVRDRVREARAEIDRWDNPPPEPPRKKRLPKVRDWRHGDADDRIKRKRGIKFKHIA